MVAESCHFAQESVCLLSLEKCTVLVHEALASEVYWPQLIQHPSVRNIAARHPLADVRASAQNLPETLTQRGWF